MGTVQSSEYSQISNIENIVNDLLNGKLKKPIYKNYKSAYANRAASVKYSFMKWLNIKEFISTP